MTIIAVTILLIALPSPNTIITHQRQQQQEEEDDTTIYWDIE
jgi:hypothetical protein